jgi:hypothetical protein
MSTRAADIIRAARAAHLPTIWGGYALPLQAHGAKFQSNFAPCCGTGNRKDATSIFQAGSGCWRWHCFRCGKGGTSIDLVAQQEGLSELDAARHITDKGDITPKDVAQAQAPAEESDPEALKEVIKGLREALQGVLDLDVLEALHEKRGINAQTVLDAADQGMLLTLPTLPARAESVLRVHCGVDALRASGLLRGKWTAACYRPLVFFPFGGKSIEFRHIKGGQPPKALQYGAAAPLILKPESGQIRRIVVVEGGIDLLSVHQAATRRDSLLIGLLGAAKHRPEWWTALAARHPDAEWLIGTDPDLAGETTAKAILEAIPEGTKARRIRAPAEDWNEALTFGLLNKPLRTGERKAA